MRSPDYTRLASQLPALYQDDAASFAQVDAYLELADDLNRAYVERLEDLAFAVGPDAALRWPTDLPLDAGADALLGSYLETYDAVGEWMAYMFPSSWGADEAGVIARRRFLAKAARLWRRRGTPRGFVDWFCVYFGLEQEASKPFLLEHFKAAGALYTPNAFTATLYVPNTAPFGEHRRRLEASDFVHWYAPAHVDMRICYVPVDRFDAFLPFTAPAVLDDDATLSAIEDYADVVRDHALLLHELACETVSEVSHSGAIHTCTGEDVATDHLGIGMLPHHE